MSEASGKRLDQYVAATAEISRSAAAKLIETKRVLVNNLQTKPSYRLQASDVVTIDSGVEITLTDKLNLQIIYEDDDCLVVNKPEGVLTHSKGAFNPEATVASWFGQRQGISGERPGIVHRLDRATSGVMILAKTADALSALQKQFSGRKAKKTYIAVVAGIPKEASAQIDMPIERNPKKPQTFRVGSNGRPAQTSYRVLKSGKDLSLLELQPTTGRTHQLRVHLSHIGHPIVGDTLYAGRPAERMMLHAQALEITLPSGKRREFEVETPAIFGELVDEN